MSLVILPVGFLAVFATVYGTRSIATLVPWCADGIYILCGCASPTVLAFRCQCPQVAAIKYFE